MGSDRSQSETTLSIRLVWPFARLLGADPRAVEVMRQSGIRAEQFGDPETRLLHRQVMKMLEATVEVLGDPTVGLRAGEQLDPADFDALEHASRSAANLGEASLCMARYFRVMNEAAHITMDVEGDRAWWRFHIVDGVPQPPAANDFCIASALAFSRRNTVVYESPLEVHLTHERPSYSEETERSFGTSVKYGAPVNAIVMRKARLEVPMLRANPGVSAAFELHAKQLLEQLEEREGISGRVRSEIVQQFSLGNLSMNVTAQRLAMSVATLRRRLEDEGTTFSGIVDELRRQLAERYLREPHPTVSEIAFLLGFSDVAAFGRAFKRWRGVSPTEYRANPRSS